MSTYVYFEFHVYLMDCKSSGIISAALTTSDKRLGSEFRF
jgi:hypothetical protein